MNVFSIVMFISAGLTAIATVLSFAIPKFRKNHLLAKMICSLMFFITGIFAAVAHGEPTAYSCLIIVALFFGLLGDFFLDWKNGKTFYAGVFFFSIGHLLYIYAFVFNRQPILLGYWKHLLIGFLVLCAASVIHIKINEIKFTGENKKIIPYCLILMFSFIFAFNRGIVSWELADKNYAISLIAASALFLISDACLATQLYGKPRIRHLDQLVAYTYFPAQALFAVSIYFQ